MKSLLFFSTALLAVSFVSCEQKGDTQKPVINLVSPAEGDTLAIGDDHGIHFDMEVTDNEGLGSYKIDIHNNFDDHGHSRHGDEGHEHEEEPFAFNKSWDDIAGKLNADVHHHEIMIPDSVAEGKYHFIVYVTDAAGNETHIVKNVVLAHVEGDHDHGHDHDHR